MKSCGQTRLRRYKLRKLVLAFEKMPAAENPRGDVQKVPRSGDLCGQSYLSMKTLVTSTSKKDSSMSTSAKDTLRSAFLAFLQSTDESLDSKVFLRIAPKQLERMKAVREKMGLHAMTPQTELMRFLLEIGIRTVFQERSMLIREIVEQPFPSPPPPLSEEEIQRRTEEFRQSLYDVDPIVIKVNQEFPR